MTRLAMVGVAFVALLIFYAWMTANRPAPTPDALPQEPGEEAGGRQVVRRGGPPTKNQRPAEDAAAGQLSVQRVLKYGRGEGELGMVPGRGLAPTGPESFAVARDGSILVADVVNQRVVVYSRDGTFLRNIELPGIALGDIIPDREGRVFIYDQVRRALHQYDTDGTLHDAFELNPKDIHIRGYFHAAGNAVFFADAAAQDVLVAVVRDGRLAPPDPSTERRAPGIHSESDRVYALSLEKGQAARVQIWDAPEARGEGKALDIPWPGIVSARFVGEDDARRFYIQTERLEDDRVVLEVLAFSATGERLAVIQMPENDYAIWTAKLVDVRGDGALVALLPQQDQAKLNLFTY